MVAQTFSLCADCQIGCRLLPYVHAVPAHQYISTPISERGMNAICLGGDLPIQKEPRVRAVVFANQLAGQCQGIVKRTDKVFGPELLWIGGLTESGHLTISQL